MDWNNIDLNSNYESSQNILESYSFDALLLELYCNIPNITDQSVTTHFLQRVNEKRDEAITIFNANINNIVRKAKQERKNR